MFQDLRFGLRMLRRTPGLTAIAALTLAFGIGANTAVFSAVDALLLDPLPFEESENLVRVGHVDPQIGDEGGVSYPELEDWRARSRELAEIAAFQNRTLALSGDGEPDRVAGLATTPNLLALLRIDPALGRAFSDDETTPGRDGVALLSHGFWQRRFGGDTSVVGRTMTLDGRAVTIAGVLPADLHYPPGQVDVWVPLSREGRHMERFGRTLSVVGRLAPSATADSARTEIEAISTQLRELHPEKDPPGISLSTLHETVVRKVRTRLLLLQGAVAFVLLIACANVAGLLMARAAARRREAAIRSSLGATRGRLARQMLVESLLVAAIGGTLGVFVAYWLVDVLGASAPEKVRVATRIAVDARALGVAALVTCATGLVFGLVPALRVSSTRASEALKEGGAASTSSFTRDRLRAALVISQIALSFVLLAGAGLLIRSFLVLESVQPGFETERALTIGLTLPEARYPDGERVDAFYRDAIARIEAVPGVESAGATRILPLVGWNPGTTFEADGMERTMRADYQTVTPRYFEAMGIPLLAGRALDERDMSDPAAAVLVNERLARRLWPEGDAVGHRIRLDEKGPWRTVVGVVGDVRQFGLDEEPRAEIYLPATSPTMTLVVRTTGDPAAVTAGVREAVRAVDPTLPVYGVRTLERVVEDFFAVRKLYVRILGVLAVVALGLALMGIYGVVAYSVVRRTREMGIRMALGARASDVVGLVIGQGLWLVAAGVMAGLAGAAAVGRLLGKMLFGISPLDPVTLVGAALVLAAAALAACAIPARRASRVEPARALRSE